MHFELHFYLLTNSIHSVYSEVQVSYALNKLCTEQSFTSLHHSVI